MTSPADLFAELPADAAEEVVQTLLSSSGVRIERIVSNGHASPPGFWYDQDEDEWVLLLRGAARLQLEGEEPIALSPGSHVNIPARRRHRVDWTDPATATIWLAVYHGATPRRNASQSPEIPSDSVSKT